MKRMVIIYGGAFNPPTKAHKAIIKALLRLARQESAALWLLPSGSRHDKTITVPSSRRLLYLRRLIGVLDHHGVEVRICRDEIDDDGPSETYRTQRQFSRNNPGVIFWWVFGSDSVATMPTWHHGSWLCRHLRIIEIPRPGYPLAPSTVRSRILQVRMPTVSSTLVRQKVAAGRSIRRYVPSELITLVLT